MINRLKELGVVGFVKTKVLDNLVLFQGRIFVKESPEDFLKKFKEMAVEKYPDMLYSFDLDINSESLIVNEEEYLPPRDLDEISIIYQGMLPVNFIKSYHPFKLMYEENYLKIRNVVKILRFVSPLILDKDLKIIDGETRLRAAIENGIDMVPVVILDADEVRADFLRLALNRSSEFQRWEYSNVDQYVDNTPQAQPLLEPLGFFGEKLLPTSFFSDTMVDYKVNPFSETQRNYRQEEGLLEWAEYRRSQMAKKHEEMYKKKKKRTPNTKPLFDLSPKEEDFEETYNVEEVRKETSDFLKKDAERITDHYEAIVGHKKQSKRTSSKEKAEQERVKYLKKLQKKYNLSDEELEQIKEETENVIDFDKVERIIKNYTEKDIEGEE